MNVAERGRGRADPAPTRTSLLGQVKDWENRKSWEEFFGSYWPLVYHLALRMGLREAEAQDVAQEVMLRVAKAMPSFEYDREHGSFKSWLFKLTQWRVKDYLRKRCHDAPGAEAAPTWESLLEELPDTTCERPDESWDRTWKDRILREAMERVKRRVSRKNFQAFEQLVTQGSEPAEVARELHMDMARVYQAKERVMRAIKREFVKLGLNRE
jgi:RNA polymerase sigma-70 factor (ECF subfamily)